MQWKFFVIRFATHEQMNKMIRPGQPYANMIGHEPREGDLLMFPSYLLHDVEVNRSNRQRISIAFNATFTAKIKDNVIKLPNGVKKND
jgi:ectoine hydroxylase-related dioxygenase (phytanoyl-CoA dioxygenase family)